MSEGRHVTSEHASRCRVADADRSGCDWGQGDRRFSAGQPARDTADWQSPRSSSRRMCRTRPYLTVGYPASSAVSEDGRRTVCWLACFDSVRAVIDLWARRQDGFSLHSEWLRSSRGRPAHSSRRGAGPRFSSARADGLGRSPRGAGMAGTPTPADRVRLSQSRTSSAVRDRTQPSRGSCRWRCRGSAELAGSFDRPPETCQCSIG